MRMVFRIFLTLGVEVVVVVHLPVHLSWFGANYTFKSPRTTTQSFFGTCRKSLVNSVRVSFKDGFTLAW